jgi:hypothetical protein
VRQPSRGVKRSRKRKQELSVATAVEGNLPPVANRRNQPHRQRIRVCRHPDVDRRIGVRREEHGAEYAGRWCGISQLGMRRRTPDRPDIATEVVDVASLGTEPLRMRNPCGSQCQDDELNADGSMHRRASGKERAQPPRAPSYDSPAFSGLIADSSAANAADSARTTSGSERSEVSS